MTQQGERGLLNRLKYFELSLAVSLAFVKWHNCVTDQQILAVILQICGPGRWQAEGSICHIP